MITLYIIFIIILPIITRNYESIYTIMANLFPKFHEISIKFEIQGNNGYLYKLESQNVLYKFQYQIATETVKEILIRNQKMEILFNLSVYESDNKIFSFNSNDIIYTENIIFGIRFSELRFFQAKPDFSFDTEYKIDDFDNDTIIYFENIDETNIFKYLLFEDKDELYENKTLYDFMKSKVLDSIIKEFRKTLLIYPECDALYHFNSLFKYFTNNQFGIEYYVNIYTYYKANVNYFNYREINKIDDVVFLQNITTKLTLIFYNDYGISYDEYDDKYEQKIISFKYISIDQNFTIGYGDLTKGEVYVFNILKQIINSIKL